jgi:hypothetical protein
MRAAIRAMLIYFSRIVDESGNHITDEAGNRLTDG